MKSNLNSQQILSIVFVSGLLIVSLASNSFLTTAFGQHLFDLHNSVSEVV
jgi:hypothetical protein